MLTAVVVTVMITLYIQRDNLIAGCDRAGQSRLLDARFFESAADARAADGDHDVAAKYRSYALQKRALIPMPSDRDVSPRARGDNRRDIVAGCHDAYPPPIPFVE